MDKNLERLEARMRASLVDREQEIRLLILALVAREHVLLVGPKGTAKSAVSRALSRGVSGVRYCERLFAPTTPPEAIFGPLDLDKLRNSEYEHRSVGFMPEAHIFFADELFRGSDAILDTMLHALGPERQALIGTRQVQLPLVTCVAATNTWPDNAHLGAIFDRWLLRTEVKPVSPGSWERLAFDGLPNVLPEVGLDHIEACTTDSLALKIEPETRTAFLRILEALNAEGVRVSDRRIRNSIRFARAAAIIENDRSVTPAHLECLQWVLWDEPSQAAKAGETIVKIANPTGAEVSENLRIAQELIDGTGADTPSRLETIKKLEEIEKKAKKLIASGNGRATKAHAYIKTERIRLHAKAMGIDEKVAVQLLGGQE